MTQKDEIRQVQEAARTIRQNVSRVIVGKEAVIDLLMVALLCEGHVLFEDVPGIGKTMLAKALAKSLGCSFQRIQFTPDLLPSDITGITFYNQKKGEFEFRPGPSSHKSCLPTRSTALRPVPSLRCWKRWKNARSASSVKQYSYPLPLSLSPPRTQLSWKERSPCQKPSLIASLCACAWITPANQRNDSFCAASRKSNPCRL